MIYRNVNKFSSDVPESKHDWHQVAMTEPFRSLDPDDPDDRGADVICLTCPDRPRFLAFEGEIRDDDNEPIHEGGVR